MVQLFIAMWVQNPKNEVYILRIAIFMGERTQQ